MPIGIRWSLASYRCMQCARRLIKYKRKDVRFHSLNILTYISKQPSTLRKMKSSLCPCFPFAAVADIIDRQSMPKIMVGDPHQQIYSFRGAINAMQGVKASHVFYLTQVSHLRFGSVSHKRYLSYQKNIRLCKKRSVTVCSRDVLLIILVLQIWTRNCTCGIMLFGIPKK